MASGRAMGRGGQCSANRRAHLVQVEVIVRSLTVRAHAQIFRLLDGGEGAVQILTQASRWKAKPGRLDRRTPSRRALALPAPAARLVAVAVVSAPGSSFSLQPLECRPAPWRPPDRGWRRPRGPVLDARRLHVAGGTRSATERLLMPPVEPPAIGLGRRSASRFGVRANTAWIRLGLGKPAHACSSRGAIAGPRHRKVVGAIVVQQQTWKCMPEPAFSSIGLARKQAVTPWRRAAPAPAASLDEVVAARSTSLR